MRVTLPFNTPEEKRLVFAQAKAGDPIAITFLRKTHEMVVWLQEEIDALNLLLENDSPDVLTQRFKQLRRRSEECDQFRTIREKMRREKRREKSG